MTKPLNFKGKFADFRPWLDGLPVNPSEEDEIKFEINPEPPKEPSPKEPEEQDESSSEDFLKGSGGKKEGDKSEPKSSKGMPKGKPISEEEITLQRELKEIKTPNWFVSKIKSVLKDNNSKRFGTNKTSGDLDFKHLYKIRTSSRVFCRKEVVDSKKYNIALLVDCSGSMSIRGKINKAGLSASMLVRDLQDMANVFVMGFNRKTKILKNFDEKIPKYMLNKKIKQPILNELYGKFSERICERGNTYSGGNHDGFALKTIYEKIKSRKGQKIIIVLSDGLPSCDFNNDCGKSCGLEGCGSREELAKELKKQVRIVEKQNIPILSIGIQTSAVKEFYKNYKVIYELSDLHKTIVTLLNKTVKRLPVRI